jgi:hypothetical protein
VECCAAETLSGIFNGVKWEALTDTIAELRRHERVSAVGFAEGAVSVIKVATEVDRRQAGGTDGW